MGGYCLTVQGTEAEGADCAERTSSGCVELRGRKTLPQTTCIAQTLNPKPSEPSTSLNPKSNTPCEASLRQDRQDPLHGSFAEAMALTTGDARAAS